MASVAAAEAAMDDSAGVRGAATEIPSSLTVTSNAVSLDASGGDGGAGTALPSSAMETEADGAQPHVARITMTPISGVSAHAPLAYLLEMDATRILLDCGWDDMFDPQVHAHALARLRALAPSLDAVLLSHSHVRCTGALPFLIARCHSKATVYGTHPVHAMAQMTAYDHVLARKLADPDFDAITLDDVDASYRLAAFDGPFVRLRYKEEVTIGTVRCVAEAAGHALGGAVWQLTASGGADRILYASDFNIRSETHLPPLDFNSLPKRVSALIVPALAGVKAPLPAGIDLTRRSREGDDPFLESVLAPLRLGGNVLLPTDTAGRALELLCRLDAAWHNDYAPLVFFNPVARNIVDFARIGLEFMNERLTRGFSDNLNMPFRFRAVKVISSETDMGAYLRGPVAVVTSSSTLDTGFARKLFMAWSADPRSCILFTDKHAMPPGSVAAKLTSSYPAPTSILVNVVDRVPLAGAELHRWLERKDEEAKQAKREADAVAARAAESAEAAGDAADAAMAAVAAAAKHATTIVRTHVAPVRSKPAEYSDEEDEPLDASLLPRSGAAPSAAAIAFARSKALRVRFAMYSHDEAPHKREVTVYGQAIDVAAMRAALAAANASQASAYAPRRGFQLSAPVPGDDAFNRTEGVNAVVDGSFTQDMSAAAASRIDHANRRESSVVKSATASSGDLQVPCKSVVKQEIVRVACRVHLYDLSARVDAADMTAIVQQLQPRRIILVRAPEDARYDLSSLLSKHCEEVLLPVEDEQVDVSSHAAVFRAVAPDDLLHDAAFQRVGDWDVAYVHASVHDVSSSSGAAVLASLAITPAPQRPPHDELYLHAGPIRVADVRKKLARAGIESELVDGGVMTSTGILVRRTMTYEGFDGRDEEMTVPAGYGLQIEGWAGPEYVRVREVLNDLFQLV